MMDWGVLAVYFGTIDPRQTLQNHGKLQASSPPIMTEMKTKPLVLASGSILAAGMAQGAIIYSGPVNQSLSPSAPVWPNYTFDLNQDGTNDFNVSFDGNTPNAEKPYVNNKPAPNSLSALVLCQANTGEPVISFGTLISSSFTVGTNLVATANGVGYLYKGSDNSVVVGEWPLHQDTAGYVGLMLKSGSKTNYGWVHLAYNTANPNLITLNVLDYGYETIVGSNIVAGATNEPTYPIIYTPPRSQSVVYGNNAQLSVRALADPPPAYQWLAGAVGSGVYTNLTDSGGRSGSATPTLNFSSVNFSHDADYVVVVSNSLRSVTSSPPATLTVILEPPTGLFLQAQGDQFTLNWAAVSGAAGYYVKRSTSPTGSYTTLATNATLAFTDPELSSTNVFYYVVSAYTGARESANSTAVSTTPFLTSHDNLGPSSRLTPIVISEIMYKPAPRPDGKNLEYIEIYNSNPWLHDLSGYQITCADMRYTFPAGTLIASNSFIVVAAVPADLQSVYGLPNVMGPYTGSLKKAETLQLLDEHAHVLLTVPYSDTYPWPVAANEMGHSIVLANPTYGEGDPRAWGISDGLGGSPGQPESFTASPLRNVLINEILSHTENIAVPQFIELYNHSATSVDVSGCILTDNPATNKLVLPAGTIIAPNGFVTFLQPQFGFTLSGTGETLYLLKPDGRRVLDALQFGAQFDGVSYGRWPDGANDFYAFTTNTPGTNNSPIRIGDVVINELMFNPISGNDDDQYIELYNQGTNLVNLAGWQLSAGVTFTFPGVTLAPNGYLVVARNPANLFAKYPNLNSGNTVGNFSGKLSHNGELVVLSMPQLYRTNTPILVAEDQVTYGTGGRWGQWADGGGSSLELIDPRANHRLAANWADSDETQKAPWTNIECTGVLDLGTNTESGIKHAQIGLLNPGECLVDNLEVLAANGTNYVANPTFESGTNDWSFQGCMVRSSLEPTGYASSQSLHIRSSSQLWTGDNSCQANLNANTLAAGQTATLRFKARWLHGWPEVLFRLNGNWLEATGPLAVPANLGSPGAANSQAVANAGPALYNVTHFPSAPAANQPAIVTAQVHAPNGLQNLTLNYRLDPATAYTAVPMTDNGTGDDAVAGDGIFSASIPGQSADTLAAFYISATDSLGANTRFPALRPGNNEPEREGLVLFGDGQPGGSFGVYRLWVTQTNSARWASLANLSNEGIDCTCVNGNRVFYNIQARFAGSPYHQSFDFPDGKLCHYKWTFNADDLFLGATDFNKIHQPGNAPGDDGSLQREQLANSFLRALGVPWLNRRFIVVYVNGNRRGTLMEDAQCPGSDMVKEYWPNDSDGYLYKMQPWFEFSPFPSGAVMGFNLGNVQFCSLMPFTTTGGVKKTARYRYNFLVRRTADSNNDYSRVFSLIDAASATNHPNYVANLQNIADMENWMRVFAANHAAGNSDSFGSTAGQNLYGYIGTQETRYSLLMWDFNIVLGNSGWGPGENLFNVSSQDTNLNAVFTTPTFRRMYWRALQELVNGPLDFANSGALLNDKYAAFTANGLNVENPETNIKPWITKARTNIMAQLAAVNAAAFVVNPSVSVSNNVAYVTGQAPVDAAAVWINGLAYPLTWINLTNWVVRVPLVPGTNAMSVVGVDRHGQAIGGESNRVSVAYGGTNASPVGQVVINEIMYAPTGDNAQFVELYNNSTNLAFDLSGWQVNGLSYTFPNGAFIAPTNYLVLAQNGPGFAAAYGATNPVFDTFAGTLQRDGETLTLGPTNLTVAKVKYQNSLPWATNADGTGAALQLIDARQDNWRPGNWTAVLGTTNPTAAPQWTYVSTTGKATSSSFYMYLQTAGDVYLDDLKLVAGSVPEAGVNLFTNGGFETAFPGPWTVSANLSGSVLSSTVKHSGNAGLHMMATGGGSSQSSSIWQTISPALVTNSTNTLSFWYLQSTNGGPLTLRLSGSGIATNVNLAPPVVNLILTAATPAAANSVAATLPTFPSLWINELEANNLTGLTNRAGQRAPWLEIYNPGTNALSLSGLYLANNYTNLLQWAFPSNALIAAGEFKVIFADTQVGLSSTNEWHASFSLTSGAGRLALTQLGDTGQPRVLDYVDYADLLADRSYGSYPDGQSFLRQVFFYPTPGTTNNGSVVQPPSAIIYDPPGSIYTQNFDALPNPGATSMNADNPFTNNGVVYALANPIDFAYPQTPTANGGLGLGSLSGWYGQGALASKFGANDGDQTTGGDLSFGLPNSSNRALGLLATSSTGGTAFGAKFINGTGGNLRYLTLSFTGELWRQSDTAKTLQFYYFIDPTATNLWPTTTTAFVPALNVAFPTLSAAKGGVPVDGTAAAYQTNRSVLNQTITNWPAGSALWLVWQMTSATGKAQGLAIDNLSFSATGLPADFTPPALILQPASGTNLMFACPTRIGLSYQLESSDTLTDANWIPLGEPVSGNGQPATFNLGVTNDQRYFRLTILP